jgi:hypothetical protein
MSENPEEPTVEHEPVETESAADFAPPRAEDAAPAATSTDTVTRRGAGLAMAGCLVVGLLLGWGVASATDDDDGQPVSFQDGVRGGGELQRGGPDGGFGHGFPGPQGHGGFPGGPGGGEYGPRGGFPGGPPDFDDERGTDEQQDEGDDEGDDQQQDEDDDPTTTTGGDT